MNALGEEISDTFAAATLLQSLPNSYDTLVIMLKRIQEDLSLSLAKKKLIGKYKRRKNKITLTEDSYNRESAMKAEVISKRHVSS